MSAWLNGVNRPLCCSVLILFSHTEAFCSVRNYILWGLNWMNWHWVTLASGFFTFPILIPILPSSYNINLRGVMAPGSRTLVSAKGSIPSRSTWNMFFDKVAERLGFPHGLQSFLVNFIPLMFHTHISFIFLICRINLEKVSVVKKTFFYFYKSFIVRR